MRNFSLKILAVFLSILFWIFVASIENTVLPVSEKIPVGVNNIAKDLALFADPGDVKITVRTDEKTNFRSLNAGDFTAFVDLRDVGVGTHILPVVITPKDPTIRIARIDPPRLSVQLDPLREKVVALTVVIEGQPSPGYRLASNRLSQQRLNLRGAEGTLADVGSAEARVKFDGNERNNVTKQAVIVVLDKNGNVMSGLDTVDPISVDVEVVELDTVKSVAVRPAFTGTPRKGVVKGVAMTPAVVTLSGKRDLLESVNFVLLEPIDLVIRSRSFTFDAKVVVPQGLTLLDVKKVSVEVEIEEVVEPDISR